MLSLLLLAGCGAQPRPLPGALPSTAAVLGSAPLGVGPHLLAIRPDGARVYAAGKSELAVIDAASNQRVATVTVDPYTAGVAITSDGKRLLLSALFSLRLTVIDTDSHAILAPVDLILGRQRGGYGRVAVSPDGLVAYVTNEINEALGITRLDQRRVESELLDMAPEDVTLSPDGGSLYLCGCRGFCTDGTIEVFDTATRRITGKVTVGPRPYRIVLSPDGTRAYTTNLGDASVSVVDLGTLAVVATITVPPGPTGLAIAPGGTRAYVVSQLAGALTVIDTATHGAGNPLPVGPNPREVVVAPDGRRVFVSTASALVTFDAAALDAAR